MFMILRGDKPLWTTHTLATQFCISEESSPIQPGFTPLAGHVQAVLTSWKCLKEKAENKTNMQYLQRVIAVELLIWHPAARAACTL